MVICIKLIEKFANLAKNTNEFVKNSQEEKKNKITQSSHLNRRWCDIPNFHAKKTFILLFILKKSIIYFVELIP